MKQVDVAIECTVDYQHEGSNFVPQIDAGGGRIDLFRLVTYREDGYVVPLKNAPVSANPAVLTRYIEAHSELNEISYSDMCSTALAKLRSNKENNRNAAAPESIRFDSISVKDTKTEWPEAGTLDYGRFPGLLRGYNLEYMNCSTGDVTYAPCIYVENTVESYVNRRMDAGIDLFAAYREKDYLPTGRAVFRGYVTEYYDPVERETFVSDASEEIRREMKKNFLEPKETIDPHRSFSKNVTQNQTAKESFMKENGIITLNGMECREIDRWQTGTADFVLGRDLNPDLEWYVVETSESKEGFEGFYTQMFDRIPSRETVEARHAKILEAARMEQQDSSNEPMIKTNMGKIPLKDFLDIKASQNGFDDYADMKAHGYMLEEENQYNGPEPTAEKITEASISPDRNMKDIKTAEYKHEEIREEPPKPAPEPKPARQKTDAYTRVMDERTKLVQELIENMKKGYIVQPAKWNRQALRPRNPVSRAEYRGINRLRLMLQTERNEYKDPRWVTFKQAQEKGWSVKKGEKGTLCEKWEWYKTQPAVDKDGQPVLDKDGRQLLETVQLPRPKCYYFVVFNGEQIHGIPKLPEPSKEFMDKNAERMMKAAPCPIIECAQSRAFYRPSEDKIYLPLRNTFKDMTSFYNVAFHEMTHSTGHNERLNRPFAIEFGSPEYAKEELRAELGSMFVAADINLTYTGEHYQDHSNYMTSWISVLENDPNELYKALRDADQAADYLMRGYESVLENEKAQYLTEKGYPYDKEVLASMAKLDILTGRENTLEDIAQEYYKEVPSDNTEAGDLIKKIGNKLNKLTMEPTAAVQIQSPEAAITPAAAPVVDLGPELEP